MENLQGEADDRELKRLLAERAREAGFDGVRVAPADLDAVHEERLRVWLDAGMHGEMGYMERIAERRAHAETVLEGARSVLVFAAPYHPGSWNHSGSENHPGNGAGGAEKTSGAASPTLRVARYALGEDYHDVLRERLVPFVEWLDSVRPGHRWRICIDSAPLLERAFAAASGLGFFGKNSLLITPRLGSFMLLAEIVTTAAIEPDPPVPGTCGTCTRCIDACPTGAITAPGIVDARRCLSYLTIEKKSPLTSEETASVAASGWVFGCDICQEVCPYNKSPSPARIAEFAEGRIVRHEEPAGTFLAPQSNGQFERRFARSPILRPGRRRVQAHARAIVEAAEAVEGRPEPPDPPGHEKAQS